MTNHLHEPIDLAPIEDRDAHAECVYLCHQPQADRRALLAEVKRLRAELAVVVITLDEWEYAAGTKVEGVRHVGAHPYRQGVQALADVLRETLGGSP